MGSAPRRDQFQIDVDGLTVLDVGASTGGFTDCLLQRGARHVYAVDVGHGQMDYKLRQDERVTVMDKTNARHPFKLPSTCSKSERRPASLIVI